MTRRNSILALVIAAVIVGAIALAFLLGGGEDRKPDRFAKPTPLTDGVPSGLEKFYTQDLEWEDCGGAECTTVEAPIDYEQPDGETLELRVKVLPAQGEGGRHLFVNPGGPGGSALDFTDYLQGSLGEDVNKRYDVVGVDPRGVGESTPVDCLSDRDFDTYAASEPDPDNPAEIQEYQDIYENLGAGCREKSGALAEHISTEEAARDMDIVRSLLGSKKLDWFGASYGTQLGATYATLFPENVGRMVLDGAVDPSLSAEESSFGQTTGFQRALEAYIEDCVKNDDCPLGNNADAAERKLADFVQDRDASPLRTGEQRELTQGLTFYGIAVTLYDKGTWPVLTQALDGAFRGDGSTLLRLADVYFEREPDGSYGHNIGEAFPAISCLDADGGSTLEQVQASIPRFEKASPVFGRMLGWGALGCSVWPIESEHPQIDIDATGSDAIVVLGTTRDPATPYEWSKALTRQLRTGVLVTRQGDGHTAYTSGNDCIQDLVDAYLVKGKVPKDGTTCKE